MIHPNRLSPQTRLPKLDSFNQLEVLGVQKTGKSGGSGIASIEICPWQVEEVMNDDQIPIAMGRTVYRYIYQHLPCRNQSFMDR